MIPVPKPQPKSKAQPKPLKRTALPARSAQPPKPRKAIAGYTRIKVTRRRRKCYAHLVHPKFKAFARAQGCILASRPGHVCRGRIEFAHDKTEATGGQDFGNGAGLCQGGHRWDAKSMHELGPGPFDLFWRIDYTAICRSLAIHYLIETYGRDWELSNEALALAATLPPEQENAA